MAVIQRTVREMLMVPLDSLTFLTLFQEDFANRWSMMFTFSKP